MQPVSVACTMLCMPWESARDLLIFQPADMQHMLMQPQCTEARQREREREFLTWGIPWKEYRSFGATQCMCP